MAARPGVNVPVQGPSGRTIMVKFMDDGSVRFSLKGAGPMTINYAFLLGAGDSVVVELAPKRGSPWAVIAQ